MTHNKRQSDASREQSLESIKEQVKELIKLGQGNQNTLSIVDGLIIKFSSNMEAAVDNPENWADLSVTDISAMIKNLKSLLELRTSIRIELDIEKLYAKRRGNSDQPDPNYGHGINRNEKPVVTIGDFTKKIIKGGNGEPWEDV